MRIYRISFKSSARDAGGALEHFRRLVAAALSVALIFTAVGNGQIVKAPATSAAQGQTLYKALYFGDGPLAAKINTVKKISTLLPADYKALEGSMITYIQKNNPTFFATFATEMQSGDRVRVAAELKAAYPIQKQAMVAVTKTSQTPYAKQVQQMVTSKKLAAEPSEPENDANVDVEAVVILFVLVLIAVVWLQRPPTELNGVTFDSFVDEIVRAVPKVTVNPVSTMSQKP
jgi:SdpC family antimicrobial peptide